MPAIGSHLSYPDAGDDGAPEGSIILTIPLSAARELIDELDELEVQSGGDLDVYTAILRAAIRNHYEGHHQDVADRIAGNAPLPQDTDLEVDKLIKVGIRVGYLRAVGIPATIDSERERRA